MFRFELRAMNSLMMLGVAALITATTARAEGVRIVLEQMTCYHLTDGEPGSEDEIYFTVGGVRSDQTPISYPKVGSATDDHWDMHPGQTVAGPLIYQGYLGLGQSAFVTVLMRESDGGLLSAISSAIGTLVSNLDPYLHGISWGTLTPLIPAAQDFTNSLSADHDQTVAALAIMVTNMNGSLLNTEVDDLRTGNTQANTTSPLGGNRFVTIAHGAGASYVITYRVELYQGDRIDNSHSGLCLDVPWGSHDSGVQVQQYPCNTGANQKWISIPDTFNSTPSYFTIINDESGKCLDVRDASMAPGGIIQQYSCHGGTNQRWHLKPTTVGQATGQIQNDGSRLCLDVPSASLSIIGIQQFTCSVPMGKNQVWAW
jgi:hypothetical protein